MTLPLFPEAAPAIAPDKITWERIPRVGGMNDYYMRQGDKVTGWAIHHCGHPTALRPYAVVHGEDHYQGYRNLIEAKANALRLMTAHRAGLRLVPHLNQGAEE